MAQRTTFSTNIIIMDMRTEITIKAEKQAIREILSSFLPLAGYDRIAWRAEIAQTKERVVAIVDFGGKRP